MNYTEFLAQKEKLGEDYGFKPVVIHDKLFDFQKYLVSWALQKGRAALFADCGLGKSFMQLSWADNVCKHTGGNTLIIAPLSVTIQTVKEAEKLDIPIYHSRDGSVGEGITITNYEMLHKFNPKDFDGVVLDESSILKHFDSKTKEMLLDMFHDTSYRLACTATPSPNDHMELGNHAQFLGIMNYVEMLSKYFYHDGGKTSQWNLKGHAEDEFWRWVCSWAVMLKTPADIGFDGTDYVLPELKYIPCVIESEVVLDADSMAPVKATSLNDQRKVRKATIQKRCQLVADMVNASDEAWVIWCELNDEADLLESLIEGGVPVQGSDSAETKERVLTEFSDGKFKKLITKSKIASFGMNWQHCRNTVYVGATHSFEQWYQSIRRFWRFGQENTVNCYMVYTDLDGAIIENLKRKEKDSEVMLEQMIKHLSIYQTTNKTIRERDMYKKAVSKSDKWEAYLGDCVEVSAELETDSIDYSIFSPPFSSLYTYSNSVRDFGNSDNYDQFFTQFSFLIKELFRITKPGRLLSFHCMNLPTSKFRDGVIGLRDFRGDLIKNFMDHGWVYHSEVVIWKDPVVAMQRTKALGLLYKQLKKDSAMSRQGIPDYLVTMRKLGLNPDPVVKTESEFTVDEWQNYASPVWMDINPSDTLQHRSAKEDKDEKHICPLQLEVIRRAVRLWTKPGDVVYSPFAGIGSEGYVSVDMGRRFKGVELKESYYQQMVKNLENVELSLDSKMITDY